MSLDNIILPSTLGAGAAGGGTASSVLCGSGCDVGTGAVTGCVTGGGIFSTAVFCGVVTELFFLPEELTIRSTTIPITPSTPTIINGPYRGPDAARALPPVEPAERIFLAVVERFTPILVVSRLGADVPVLPDCFAQSLQ